MVLQALFWSIWITDEQMVLVFCCSLQELLDWPAAVCYASAFELDKKQANIEKIKKL